MDNPIVSDNDQRSSNADQSTKENIAGTSEALARRRLLKGTMVAAPAIFTLQSGAARAAISNLRCLENAPPFDPNTDGVHVDEMTDDTEDPNWYRESEPVKGFEIQNAAGGIHYLIEIPPPQQHEDEQGRLWKEIDVMNPMDIDNPVGGFALQDNNPLTTESVEFFTTRRTLDRFRIIYVNNDGDYVTSSTLGNPVTVSCWESFANPDQP